jgi:hypothetical protein
MVMELSPRYGNLIRPALCIEQPIVVILPSDEAHAVQIAMIDPDVRRRLQINCIAFLRRTEHQVANDNIAHVLQAESALCQTGTATHAEERSVARYPKNTAAGELPSNLDHTAGLESSSEFCTRGHSGACSRATSSCTRSEANKLVNRCGARFQRYSKGRARYKHTSNNIKELHDEVNDRTKKKEVVEEDRMKRRV